MTGVEDKTPSQSELEETDFQALYEQSVKQLKEGELVEGRVVQVTRDAVIVDIGYKSEGQVPLREFLDKDGNHSIEAGQDVSVLLERWEDDQGYVVLSKSKADQMKVWDDIIEAAENNKTINGVIVERVKGGYHVDIQGVIAFLPNSQVDLKPVLAPDKLIGVSYDFIPLKYNKRKNNVIVSRRVLLEKDREAMRGETLEKLEEGAVVEGYVKNITDYGAFLDLGGIDGLLHLTDMSWGKINHPSQVLNAGDTINVKVLKFDKENNKISLGLKQTMEDPWESAEESYPAGKKVSGRVVNLTDYGAFVELEQGLEGLVHISEMSWTKLRHPSQKLKVDDKVDVMVLNVDTQSKRISLGLKQVESNPWEELENEFPKGSTIKGTVKNITDFGIFIGIKDGIDGLVHISDLSWTKIKHPSELYSKGQEVEALVLNIDKSAQRFSLSTKALEKNPWEGVEDRYKPGLIADGKVTGVADFGAFVELEKGLEGLVHISEINRGSNTGIEVGDTVRVEVLNVDPQEKKIGLSIRERLETASEPSDKEVEAKEAVEPEPATAEAESTEPATAETADAESADSTELDSTEPEKA